MNKKSSEKVTTLNQDWTKDQGRGKKLILISDLKGDEVEGVSTRKSDNFKSGLDSNDCSPLTSPLHSVPPEQFQRHMT